MKKTTKRLISLAVSAIMMVASANLAFADPEEAGKSVEVKTYIDGSEVFTEAQSTVFVGEQIRTDIRLKNFERIDGYDFVLRYDNSVVQLYDKALGAELSEDGAFNDSPAIIDNDSLQLDSELSNSVYPNAGVLLSARAQDDAVSVTSDTLFASVNFIVKAAGNASLRFASTSADHDYIFNLVAMDVESANPQGVLFTEENPIFTTVPNNVTAIAAPDPASDLAWAEGERDYNISWTAPSTGCRGYIVKLLKVNELEEYEQVGEDVEVTSTSYDLASAITSPGTYNFSVTAKGGTNNSAPVVSSTEKVVTKIPMDTVAASYNDATDVVSWTAVEHAGSYVITVVDTATSVEVINHTVSDPEATSYADLLGDRVGEFDITVTAVPADDMHQAYSETPITYNTGSTVTGVLKFGLSNGAFGLTDKMAGRIDTSFMPNVTLTNVENTELKYTAKAGTDGTFNIRKVPVGTYTVKIHGTSVVTRELQNAARQNLVVIISETGTYGIAAEGGMGVLIGDLNNDVTINLLDVTALIKVNGVTSESGEYEPNYDFVGGTDNGTIGSQELNCLIALFNKGPANYRVLTDNNLTVLE